MFYLPLTAPDKNKMTQWYMESNIAGVVGVAQDVKQHTKIMLSPL